jgi:hypothetical protein
MADGQDVADGGPARAGDQSLDARHARRLELLAAGLMAIIVIAGAIVSWRASVAADGAGDADFAGQHAALYAEETRALSSVDAYQHVSSFTIYRRNTELGALIERDLKTAPPDEQEELAHLRGDSHDLAKASQRLFPTRFMNRDGDYAVQREIGEAMADAARERDMDYQSKSDEADRLRLKTGRLLGLGVMLMGGLLCAAVATLPTGRWGYGLLGIGTLVLLVASGLAVALEYGLG